MNQNYVCRHRHYSLELKSISFTRKKVLLFKTAAPIPVPFYNTFCICSYLVIYEVLLVFVWGQCNIQRDDQNDFSVIVIMSYQFVVIISYQFVVRHYASPLRHSWSPLVVYVVVLYMNKLIKAIYICVIDTEQEVAECYIINILLCRNISP